MNVRRLLQSIHPDHMRIARGAFWVAIFVFVGKLAGAGKEMAIAYYYGVGGTVDAYQVALTLTTWLPSTLVSALTIILVPILVEHCKLPSSEGNLFLSELQGNVILLGLLLTLMSVGLSTFALPQLAGQLSDGTHKMVQQFTLSLAPTALLTLMIGVYGARLMAQGRQVNTLLESMPAVVILLFIILSQKSNDIFPLIWGTLLGFTVQTIWLWRLLHESHSDPLKPRFTQRSKHWSGLYKSMAIMAAGQFVMSFITPLDQYYASQLGDGAISTLGYANRVTALLLGIGAMAISRAALPVIADLHSNGNTVHASKIALKWTALMLAGGTLVAIANWLIAPMVIGLLFQRGEFHSEDTKLVAEIFRLSVIQVPFYFAGLVLVQLIASRRRYDIIAIFAATNFLVKWALNFALVPMLGLSGIALSTGVMYFYSVVCLYGAARLTFSSPARL